jgi:hypothetical protein
MPSYYPSGCPPRVDRPVYPSALYRAVREKIRSWNSSRSRLSGGRLTTTRRSIEPGNESRLRRKTSRISRLILLRATAFPTRLGTAIPSRQKPKSFARMTVRKTPSVNLLPLLLSRSKSLLFLIRSLLVKVFLSTNIFSPNSMSVCGIRPAQIVLPTIHLLGGSDPLHKLWYARSSRSGEWPAI